MMGVALPSWCREALAYSIELTRRNLFNLRDFPERAEDGRWICVENGSWVGGHWVGLLWRAYEYSTDPLFREAAYEWADRLAPRQFDETTHDLGFLFELSYVLGYRLTGDTALKAPALQAAQTLSRRFNRRGNFFQAWGALDAVAELRGRAIVDTMMNLELLFWASQECGDPGFHQMAEAHARTCLACQVRPDGSTAHVADFDPESGVFLKQDTHQGLSATSCWSRGQSWAVYGFSSAYHAAGDESFLQAARRLAEYALQRLPADGAPYWDYASPAIPHDVRDTSAGAILAAGLLRLASVEPDPSLSARWKERATGILAALWEQHSSRGSQEPCILLHGTRSKPHGMMDHGLIYGDYHFVEALLLLKGDVL